MNLFNIDQNIITTIHSLNFLNNDDIITYSNQIGTSINGLVNYGNYNIEFINNEDTNILKLKQYNQIVNLQKNIKYNDYSVLYEKSYNFTGLDKTIDQFIFVNSNNLNNN